MLQARISKTFAFLKRQNKHPHVRYPSLVRCQCLHGLALGVQLCGFLADSRLTLKLCGSSEVQTLLDLIIAHISAEERAQ